MRKELKPCPFCGSDATVYVVSSGLSKGYRVSCKADDPNFQGTSGVIDDWCPMELETPICRFEDEAIEIWNRRAK